MKGLALLLVLAASPLAAQVPNLWEGEAMVGVTGQNDVQRIDRVKLSPVGLSIGFIVQPVFGARRLSVSDQLSFYPGIDYERAPPFDTLPPPSSKPLILNTTWVRLASNEPEAEGSIVVFAGTGVSVAVVTPRSGQKVAPVIGVGIRRWFARQFGVEMSLQCTLMRLGRTACQLPITTVWPFSGGPTEGS